MACCSLKTFVWCLWAFNLCLSAVYLGISMVTFHNVQKGFEFFILKDGSAKAFRDSVLASCILSFIVVLFWVVFSFCVLLGRFVSSLTLGYGLMLGSCSHTGLFSLLAGLVLQAAEPLAAELESDRHWNQNDYHIYLVTYAFNYILCGTYLLMFFVLLFASDPFTNPKERGTPYVMKAGSSSAGTPSAVQMGGPSGMNGSNGFYSGTYNGVNV